MPTLTPLQHLKALKAEFLKNQHQTFPPEEIDSICKKAKYTDKTANGLTKMIVDFITFSGGYATRVQSQGQYNKKLNRFTKSTTKKGLADVNGVINAIPLYIEVKIDKDKQSPDQVKHEREVTKAGGKYYIAKTFEAFYEWINKEVLKKN